MRKIALCSLFMLAASVSAAETGAMRVFYFGNSLTANTMPEFHKELGQSAGKDWTADAMLGAGWQLWQHREQLGTDKALFAGTGRGEYTIDPAYAKSAGFAAKKFYKGQWDAIVLQSFASHLTNVVTQMWGKYKFDAPKDTGDVQSAADIVRHFLKLNPHGRACIYVNWPPMEPGKPQAGQRGAEFPDRKNFDYEKQWLKKYAPTDKPWIGNVNRTRDFNFQLFDALKAAFPELWKQGRLQMIPTGDIFLALDKKMRAGQVPGIKSIEEFYTDVQHIRIGLPRYTAAAAFYAVLFQEHPGKLDWKLYGTRSRYRAEDRSHDDGELLEITPERAKIVNDTIWEVLTTHPYTGVKK